MPPAFLAGAFFVCSMPSYMVALLEVHFASCLHFFDGHSTPWFRLELWLLPFIHKLLSDVALMLQEKKSEVG